MLPLEQAYRGRRVLITGVTGFKGAWLANWLLAMGAEVSGFANAVPTTPAMFEVTGLRDRVAMHWGDIRELAAVQAALAASAPDIVFHLAAQALVSISYQDPKTTFDTNCGGTVNVLEALRLSPGARAAVLITSDKCYHNVEWEYGYRETDRLGGHDPYSASKAAAEIAIAAYHDAFLGTQLALASARAGNVIGGGDWARDRIVPDTVRAWAAGHAPTVRNPHATRPWQHVLEPLSGYLWLGAQLLAGAPGCAGEAFNFGPAEQHNYTVGELLTRLHQHWPGHDWTYQPASIGREANLLRLCCDKAAARLRWRAVLDFSTTARLTADWYRAFYDQQADMRALTAEHVQHYTALARERHLEWAGDAPS